MSSSRHTADTNRAGEPIEGSLVAKQLDKILSSYRFEQSPRCAAFLKFVVEETLAGRSDFLKGPTIAIAVFDRHPNENPEDDPIVRIQAGRVRKRLSQYYAAEGAGDPIRISVPSGSYLPLFQVNPAIESHEDSAIPEESKLRRKRLPRIGVLPLANRAGSPEYDYFADGLGEELTTELARLQGLAVLAYWTTSQFRNDTLDLRAVGRELSADFLVCGSLARYDERVRISVECVNAETGDQIWAERFDRNLTTAALFDIQDEVVRQVVACIGDYYGSISQSMFQVSRDKRITELSAYEAILSNHYYVRRLDQQTHGRALAALEHAVKVEPNYALAWAMLSALYCDIHAYSFNPLDAPLDRGEECVQHAMALDENCQHSHYASAYVGILKRDHPRVIAACENMVGLNPNAAYMMGAASIFLAMAGRIDRAFPLFERSLELNPYHPGWFHFLPWLHAFVEHDYDRALAAVRRFNMPTFLWDPLLRAATLGKLGQRQEAVSAYEEVLNLQPNFASQPDFYIDCFVHSDDTRADMLDGLRVAGLP